MEVNQRWALHQNSCKTLLWKILSSLSLGSLDLRSSPGFPDPLNPIFTGTAGISALYGSIIRYHLLYPTSRTFSLHGIPTTRTSYHILGRLSLRYFSLFPLNLVILRSELCHELTNKSTNLAEVRNSEIPTAQYITYNIKIGVV